MKNVLAHAVNVGESLAKTRGQTRGCTERGEGGKRIKSSRIIENAIEIH